MEASPPSATVLAVSGWSGALDERTLRDALCQQAITQVETVLEMARDRRAAAALLTPAQVTQLPQLQAGDLLKAIKR